MATPRAHVAGDVLRWARESRGFSLKGAAKRLGVKPERLEDWESNNSAPTVKQLRRAAHIYARPIGVFFLAEPPEPDDLIRDFRRVPDSAIADLSPALTLEIRLARERRQEALDLAAEAGHRPKPFPEAATLREATSQVAGRLRKRLGVSLEAQKRWTDQYFAFNAWRAALEAVGVLVFQTGGTKLLRVEVEEARGFSLSEQPLPVVVVNGRDAPAARCFTLIHELTHVSLQRGGLCDLHSRTRGRLSDRDRVEAFCNQVAGEVLVPTEELIREPSVSEREKNPSWSDAELRELARRFWVSREVVLRRLLALGLTSERFYRKWRAENPPRPPAAGGPIPPPDRSIRRNGRLFSRLVLAAYHDRRIPLSEASRLLGTGPQYVRDVALSAFDSRWVA